MVQALEENPDHVKAKWWMAEQLRKLGLSVIVEYEFTLIGLFGTSPKSIVDRLKALHWTFTRMKAKQRAISPATNNTAFYTHNYDNFYEGSSSKSGLSYRGVIEIDGEYHDPEVDYAHGIRQILDDKLAEIVFGMWFADPKEFYRVRKAHVLRVMEDSKDIQNAFIQYILKGKYKDIDAYNITNEKLIELLEIFAQGFYSKK